MQYYILPTSLIRRNSYDIYIYICLVRARANCVRVVWYMYTVSIFYRVYANEREEKDSLAPSLLGAARRGAALSVRGMCDLPLNVVAVDRLAMVIHLVSSRAVPNLSQRLVILRALLRAVGTVLDIPSSRHTGVFIEIRGRVDQCTLVREVLMVLDLPTKVVGSCLVIILIVNIPSWVFHVEVTHGQVMLNGPFASGSTNQHLWRVVVKDLCEHLLCVSLRHLDLLHWELYVQRRTVVHWLFVSFLLRGLVGLGHEIHHRVSLLCHVGSSVAHFKKKRHCMR